MICAVCGAENRVGSHYCRQCGHNMAVTSEVSAEFDSKDISPNCSSLPSISNEIDQSINIPIENKFDIAPENHFSEDDFLVAVPDPPATLRDTDSLIEEPTGHEHDPSHSTDENNEDASILTNLQSISSGVTRAGGEEFEETLDKRMDSADHAENRNNNQMGLQENTLLQNRYRILRQIEQGENYFVYTAEDLRQCWNCKSIQSDPDPHFCEMCGAELSQFLQVNIRQVKGQPVGLEPIFSDGDSYYIIEETEIPQIESRTEKSIFYAIGYISGTGNIRDIDEDSLLIMDVNCFCEANNAPIIGAYAIADGIGGYEAGEVASRTAIRALARAILENLYIPAIQQSSVSDAEIVDNFKICVKAANQAVFELKQDKMGDNDLGCTLASVILSESTAYVANVGDSRTYLMRAGHLTQITRDHSVLADMIASGTITPQEAYIHQQKGVIYRSLGDKEEIEVDYFPLSLEIGDRLLLCCDGVWEMLHDSIIEDVLLQYSDPQYACRRLYSLANDAGGEDNITAIVINIQNLF